MLLSNLSLSLRRSMSRSLSHTSLDDCLNCVTCEERKVESVCERVWPMGLDGMGYFRLADGMVRVLTLTVVTDLFMSAAAT